MIALASKTVGSQTPMLKPAGMSKMYLVRTISVVSEIAPSLKVVYRLTPKGRAARKRSVCGTGSYSRVGALALEVSRAKGLNYRDTC